MLDFSTARYEEWRSKCRNTAILFYSYAGRDKDGSIRGQLEVSARRVDYIITKRNPNEPPAQQDDEKVPF